jgi:hypothetical protein
VFTSDPLTIYLQDHYGGASFGAELARRARGENEGTDLGEVLARIAREIEEDRTELRAIMARLDVGPDRAKVLGGWAMEKAGRLKLNGRLLGYAPLSPVLELEGLISGVRGKLALWRALRGIAPGEPRLDVAELDRLAARAELQLEALQEEHDRLTREVLTPSR